MRIKRTPVVYLAGRMTGLTRDEKASWREEAATALQPFIVLDPVQFELPSHKPRDIVRTDLGAIARCDVVLAYVGVPSWGTAMELWFAKQVGTPVVAWTGRHLNVDQISPWLAYTVNYFCPDLDLAIDTVRSLFRDDV